MDIHAMNNDMVFTIWPWPEGLSTPARRGVLLYHRAGFFGTEASISRGVWKVEWQNNIHDSVVSKWKAFPLYLRCVKHTKVKNTFLWTIWFEGRNDI